MKHRIGSTVKYVHASVENVEKNLVKSNQRLPTCCKNPIISGYIPETYTLPELKDEGVTQYQEIFGLPMWYVSTPQSTLKKKVLSICYHKCREAVAVKVAWIAREGTTINLTDMFRKMLVQIRCDFFLISSRTNVSVVYFLFEQ